MTSREPFAALVEAHQQAVRAFLRRLCGDPAEADDLAQEVFIAAWTSLDSFRRGADFRLWLYGIAYRKFLMSRRAAGRRRKREALVAEVVETAAASDTDARLDLQKAMMALSEPQSASAAGRVQFPARRAATPTSDLRQKKRPQRRMHQARVNLPGRAGPPL